MSQHSWCRGGECPCPVQEEICEGENLDSTFADLANPHRFSKSNSGFTYSLPRQHSELVLPSLQDVSTCLCPHTTSPVDVGELESTFQNLEQWLAHTGYSMKYNVLNKMGLTNEGDSYKAIKEG